MSSELGLETVEEVDPGFDAVLVRVLLVPEAAPKLHALALGEADAQMSVTERRAIDHVGRRGRFHEPVEVGIELEPSRSHETSTDAAAINTAEDVAAFGFDLACYGLAR